MCVCVFFRFLLLYTIVVCFDDFNFWFEIIKYFKKLISNQKFISYEENTYCIRNQYVNVISFFFFIIFLFLFCWEEIGISFYVILLLFFVTLFVWTWFINFHSYNNLSPSKCFSLNFIGCLSYWKTETKFRLFSICHCDRISSWEECIETIFKTRLKLLIYVLKVFRDWLVSTFCVWIQYSSSSYMTGSVLSK